MTMEQAEARRPWWKLWSNRLALVAGTVAMVAVENPELAAPAIEALPSGLRGVAAFAVAGLLPIVVRMLKQPAPNVRDGQ